MSLARLLAITKGCGRKHAMPTPTPLRVRARSVQSSFPPDKTMFLLTGKSIVLGVSGGIAAFKSAMVASQLVQAGAKVDVLMTQAATHFIQPLTFNGITRRPVHTDVFAPISELTPGHVEIALDADLIIVAPATARTIAALALGLSDDLISLVVFSSSAPVLIAPAMEDHMYNHPATQANIATLVGRGVTIVGPDYGRLASGQFGTGRLAAPEVIVGAALGIVSRRNTLKGRKIVVTAGGTREALDPVRFLGNRSSGRMGFALAEAAVNLGADVVLIAGPNELLPPPGTRYIPVESTQDMLRAVEEEIINADALIMAAAVADYRPAEFSSQKLKKKAGQTAYVLELVPNPDILASIDRPHLLKIGFAAETEDLIENALRKLRNKGLAMIIANDAAATIGAGESQATILTQDGSITELPRLPKRELAATIIDSVAKMVSK
jgi:phosphopantothenoylcysteine decarboxylase / phosphopantothenate---cysteine ligase